MKNETAPVERLVYSIPDACEAAGVSRSTLYLALKARELAILKVGDRTLIEPDELRRWLASKRQSAA